MNETNLPPADVGIEEAVLCAAILSQDLFEEAQEHITAEHYYLDAHQRIWRALEELHRQSKQPDMPAVAAQLKSAGDLDKIGGTPFLAQILNAPAIASVGEHAQRIRDKWRLRELIRVCRETQVAAFEAHEAESTISGHSEALEAVIQARQTKTQATLKDAAGDIVREYEARKSKGVSLPGIPTGLADLDRKIGGWKRGCMYVVAARPGIGKTGFAVTSSLAAANAGHGVIFISLEMPSSQLTARIVAQEAKLNTRDIDSGGLGREDMSTFIATAQRVSKLPVVFDDNATQTAQSIRVAVRRALKLLKKEHPDLSLGLIVVDYLQIMTALSKRQGSREQDVTEMSAACLKLAKEFNCATLALSQLNRGVESRPDKRPLMSDLRESGAIEQDAFGVIMLYREDYYRKDGEELDGSAEVIVRKLRQGGEIGTVHANFHGPSTSFGNKIPEYDFEMPYADFG